MQGELTTPYHCDDQQRTVKLVVAAPALDEGTRSFVRRALAAGLVEIDDLKKVVVSLMADSPQFTPQRLADGLVGAGILTPWQKAKLLAGKSKGFYLGSYRLLRPLGKGGMGVVYLGEHQVMKRLMALKILPPKASKDQRRIARFKEEARACAQLDHPNIVRAYDFSEAGGKLYIVIEYVDGIDLQQVVVRDGVMGFSDAMDVLIQATEGLAHAHQRGIIHRDIKPSNLLLRTDGVLKVSDLGLARIGWSIDDESEKRRLMGTADFVSPEQAINSKAVDARADIYSLSCSLFFLLTGRSPYQGDTMVDEAFYQATIDDTSLSADGEVATDNEVEEFDFAALPPVDLGKLPNTPAKPVALPGPSPRVTSKRSGGHTSADSGHQQILLGVGLAVASIALVAVVGLGAMSFMNPLPQTQPTLKAVEDGKGGRVVIIKR